MIYRFDGFELDARLCQLRYADQPVSIEPKVFDVLAYLLHHRDRVVSKDELLEKLWPGQVVSETALTRCIMAARKAVHDDGTKQAVIETQHGRGYRFVAAVTEQMDEPVFQFERTEEPLAPAPFLFSPSEDREGLALSPSSPEAGEGQEKSSFQLLPSDGSTLPVQFIPARMWSRGRLAVAGLLILLGVVATVQ